MKWIYTLFTELMNEPNTTYLDCVKYEPRLYLYQPNIALDWTFLKDRHTFTPEVRAKLMADTNRYLAHVEYMTYFILNVKDDVEFSLRVYPSNFTLKSRIHLLYLERG
jgi:hypothetical protein